MFIWSCISLCTTTVVSGILCDSWEIKFIHSWLQCPRWNGSYRYQLINLCLFILKIGQLVTISNIWQNSTTVHCTSFKTLWLALRWMTTKEDHRLPQLLCVWPWNRRRHWSTKVRYKYNRVQTRLPFLVFARTTGFFPYDSPPYIPRARFIITSYAHGRLDTAVKYAYH